MNVELLNYFGGDINHSNVARVSYQKEASGFTYEQNAKLLNYLAKHGHTSPFRHSNLQFRIRCSIYVERQLHKHHVGVEVNSISGRYVDFADSYYFIPIGEWRKQSTSSKQGSDGLVENQEYCNAIQEATIRFARKNYDLLIAKGVAMEQARSILPLSLETEYITTMSFQAFVHMCNLRLKPDTQAETRDVVTEMLKQVHDIEGHPFKESLKAFNLE